MVQEWNTGFFLPRGLPIIAMIQAYSSKQNEVNFGSSYDETALSKAASQDNFPLVQTLLFKGVQPDIKPSGGARAIYHAVDKKHYSITQLLLQHGVNIDHKPLHLAGSRVDIRTLASFLSHGANIEDKNWSGSPPLFDGAARGDIPVMRLARMRIARR
jgi:ankyrin repeat protein